jgi:FMN reductase
MLKKEKGVTVVVINGSVRPNNYTSKASALVVDEFRKYKNAVIEFIDPGEFNLMVPGYDQDASVEALQKIVSRAAGVVLATPEYHGSYSSTIKLVIDNLGFPSVLAEKPVVLLGVASGQIGAVKALEHLRSVCSHVGALVLPGTVSIAGVRNVFDEHGHCKDKRIEQRLRRLAGTLMLYIQKHVCPHVALEETVREN